MKKGLIYHGYSFLKELNKAGFGQGKGSIKKLKKALELDEKRKLIDLKDLSEDMEKLNDKN